MVVGVIFYNAISIGVELLVLIEYLFGEVFGE
jgi:hypothetical protein